MRSNTLIFMLLIGAVLAGCSNKPGVEDIEAELRGLWGECEGLKMTDLKKLNGVDYEKYYEISYSYKLEIKRDASAKDAWDGYAICPPSRIYLFIGAGKLDDKFMKPLKKGEFINVADTAKMVKSEKGWIAQ